MPINRHALKVYRTDLRRLSLAELAARCGVTTGYLSKVENGVAVPGEALVLKLAYELGIPVNALAVKAAA